VKKLEERGHRVKIVAINKDRDLELLDTFGLEYDVVSNTSGKNSLEKVFIFLATTLRILITSIKFRPDIYIGRASPMIAINNFIFHKKHILFEDSEPAKFSLLLCRMFSNVIITPQFFSTNLGPKHIRINSYKELFYLHPTYYIPNPNVLSFLNLNPSEKLIIVRFVSWASHHDIGQHGILNKNELIKELNKYGKIFISSESPLDKELIKYQLNIPIELIHDVINYADIFISDSQTMTTEAAILGTPAIRCNTFVGRKDMSNFIELENKYNLIYNIKDFKEIIKITETVLNKKNIKQEWLLKQKKLLNDKINPVEFFLRTINKTCYTKDTIAK
jgi:predicted glycosyltransferase